MAWACPNWDEGHKPVDGRLTEVGSRVGAGAGAVLTTPLIIDSVSPLFSADFDQLQMIRAQHLLLAYNRFWNGDDGRKKKADNRSLCPHDGDPHDVQAA